MERELSGIPQRPRHRPVVQMRLSPQTMNNMRCKGTGPSYYKHGRRILYDVDELRAWSVNFKTKHPQPFEDFE